MKTEWDYTHLYSGIDAWKKDYDIVQQQLAKFEQQIKTNSFDYDSFLSMITTQFQIEEIIERLYCYGKRHVDQDNTDEAMTKLYQQAWSLYTKLLQLKTQTERLIIDHQSDIVSWGKNLEMKPYQSYIETLFAHQQYTLSDTGQAAIQVLMGQQTAIQQLYRALMEQDIVFGTFVNQQGKIVESNQNNVVRYLKSPDSNERRDAFLANMTGYQQLQHTMAHLYNMKLDQEITMAHLKHYDSVLAMTLDQALLPNDIVTKLIETIEKHLDLLKRYHNIKKQAIGLKEYHNYDTTLPIGTISTQHYVLEEAIEIIRQALAILGESSLAYIDQALAEGWVDFFEKPHKRKDSFTAISYTGVPYVSVNFHNNYQSLKTLCHEFGHMIHTAYAKDHQPFVTFEYSLFLAEIASKVNELLLTDYLLQHSKTTAETIYLLDQTISGMINSLYYQTMMTEFEVKAFQQKQKNKNVTDKFLNETYLSLYQKYHGDTVIVEKSLEHSWEKIPHYYLYESYYLWQYATGLAIAGAIVYQLQHSKGFVDKYIAFLSLGKSVSVTEALKTIHIDLTDGHYIEDALKVLDTLLSQLETLVQKHNIKS